MNNDRDTLPWWKYGHVWLVIGGPLVVVIAACATGVIAVLYQDPVLAADYYKQGLEINKTLDRQAAALLPAEDAFKQAQTGGVAATSTQK